MTTKKSNLIMFSVYAVSVVAMFLIPYFWAIVMGLAAVHILYQFFVVPHLNGANQSKHEGNLTPPDCDPKEFVTRGGE